MSPFEMTSVLLTEALVCPDIITKIKIMQNSGISISGASASSDLAVTSDCGHSLRFTPRRWRRGQTSTWQGLLESHRSTGCHGDGWWRTQEVKYNRSRLPCYSFLFFLLLLNSKMRKERNEQRILEKRVKSWVSLARPLLVSLSC